MKSNKKLAQEGIKAEREAIAQYNRMLKQTKDPKAKRIIRHINKDEREHVKEFRELAKVDPPKREVKRKVKTNRR